LLLNYTNMLKCKFLLQQISQEIKQRKRMTVYALKYSPFYSLGVRAQFHFTRTFLFWLWFRYL
jgi:hypothetical protein